MKLTDMRSIWTAVATLHQPQLLYSTGAARARPRRARERWRISTTSPVRTPGRDAPNPAAGTAALRALAKDQGRSRRARAPGSHGRPRRQDCRASRATRARERGRISTTSRRAHAGARRPGILRPGRPRSARGYSESSGGRRFLGVARRSAPCRGFSFTPAAVCARRGTVRRRRRAGAR
jgi:hypothetical protein